MENDESLRWQPLYEEEQQLQFPNKKYPNKLTTFYLVVDLKNSISDLQVEPLSQQRRDLVKNREPSFSYGFLLRNYLSV